MTGMEIDLLHAVVEGGVSKLLKGLDAREGVVCRCSNCEHSCDTLTGHKTGKCGLRNPVIGEDGRCMSQVTRGGKQLVFKLANALAQVRSSRLVDGALPPNLDSYARKLITEAASFCEQDEGGDDE